MVNPSPAPRLTAFTANMRGLTGGKLRDALLFMQLESVQLGVLTETHSKESPEVLLARTPGAGAISGNWLFHYVSGTGHTGGVVIAISTSSAFAAFRPWPELDGAHRILRLDGSLDGAPASLLGIYAPAQVSDRRRFFGSVLPAYLPQDGRLIIAGGDFNVALDHADIVGPDGAQVGDLASRGLGAGCLKALMEQLQLKDVWREHAAPGERAFTHWSGSAGSGARLDFWLVSEQLLASATSRIEGPFAPGLDHRPVSLSLRSAQPQLCGKGINGFPSLVFGLQPAFEALRVVVAAEAAKLMAGPPEGLVTRWSDAKERFRKAAHLSYGRHRRTQLQGVKAKAAAAAEAARKLAAGAAGAGDPAQLLQAWRVAELEAAAAWSSVLRPVKEAASMMDQVAGEAATYFFHSRARVRPQPAHILTLNRPGRQPGSPPDPAATATFGGLGQALHYARAFYSSESPFGLFRQFEGVTEEAQSTLLGSLGRRLDDSHAALAEGPDGDGLISREEMQLAIESANRGSAPGWDGLPYEFYRVFAAELTPVLVRVFNAAFQDALTASPLTELLTGVICLLEKPGQSKEEVAGYRPITLLNTDVKLVMWIHSGRLQLPLDYLIDIGQSAFLRARDISDNVRYHLHLAARLQELGTPGWLLLIDMSKAYDSVARGWLRSSMVAMGFRESGAARWCRLLLDGSACRVRINGAFSEAFPVSGGLFQGSSLSCQEWVIALQPLVSYLGSLQAQGRISHLLLPSAALAPAACAHADDTKLVALDPDRDGPAIKEAFAVARAAGLPALNSSKSCLLPLFSAAPQLDSITLVTEDSGERRHGPTGFRTLLPGHQPHRLLGVPFSVDADSSTTVAYANLLPKVRAGIQVWRPQRLTVRGRSHVCNQSLASKLVYQSNFSNPEGCLPPVQLALSGFICSASTPEEEAPFDCQPFLRQRVLSLRPACGGVGAPELSLSAASMRAKPLWKAFAHSSHPVGELLRHEASRALPHPSDAPPGLHCLVTRPGLHATFPTHATRSTVHAVQAFRQLKVQRIATPAQQDHWSVMQELTFAPAGSNGGLLQALATTPKARGWLRLSQVRAAWTERELLEAEELVDLEAILAAIPTEWRAAVQREALPEPEWACVCPAAGHRPAVFRGQDLGSAPEGESRLWELWPSGVLVPLSFPVVVGDPCSLSPALVVWRPKPRGTWSRSEMVAAAAQLGLPAAQRVGIREPHLVGVWADLQLDPRVFGVPACPGRRECSLLDMTARRARMAVAHLQLSSAAASSDQFILGYKEEGAAFPPSWRQAPAGEGADLAAQPLEALERLGLAGQEEKWRRSAEELRLHHSAAGGVWAINQPARWVMDPGAIAPPRPSPSDRAAARLAEQEAAAAAEAARAQQQLPTGFAEAWKRLADPTIHRPHWGTMWRVMHARLGCGAFLAHVRSKGVLAAGSSASAIGVPLERSFCQASCCSQLPAPPLETISHALLLCPAAAPAVAWMREVWAHLADVSIGLVPAGADVLLADNLDSWPDAPVGKPARQLWTRLRVATLGAIWQARCERDAGGLLPGVSLARRAATLALDSVRGAILRDWSRAEGVAPAALPSMCAAWFRGFDASITLQAFKQQWAVPEFFCSVQEDDGFPPTLEIHLGGPDFPLLPD